MQENACTEPGTMRPLEIYQADIALEKEISAILGKPGSGKKEKIRLLTALRERSRSEQMRSHVQYYLDSLQARPADIALNILAVSSVLAFAVYAAWQLARHF